MRDSLMAIAKEAGAAILSVYEKDFEVEYKDDRSPLTEADRLSHERIVEGLASLDAPIPVLSEEGKDIPYEERVNWQRFWLVDPLDGTKEFVKRNGEFTVNIALIEQGYPVLGVIYVPVTDVLYYGEAGKEAVKIASGSMPQTLAVRKPESGAITIVESRSHPSPELESFMSELQQKYSSIDRISKGSSLKFCAVAEGSAHLYPAWGRRWSGIRQPDKRSWKRRAAASSG